MTTISDEALLDELRQLGTPPNDPPTLTDLRERGRFSDWPYYDRWGSWGEALAAAGYEKTETRGRPEVPADRLLFDLRLGAIVLGHSPSYDEYRSFGQYEAQTLANRFGGWAGALDAAELPPSGEEHDLTVEDVDPPE